MGFGSGIRKKPILDQTKAPDSGYATPLPNYFLNKNLFISKLTSNNVLADGEAGPELLLHDLERGLGDVEGGVLLWVGGRDDRHDVEAVRHVVPRVPHLEPQPKILNKKRDLLLNN